MNLTAETGVLEAKLRQCHFAHYKFYMNSPGRENGPPWCEAGD